MPIAEGRLERTRSEIVPLMGAAMAITSGWTVSSMPACCMRRPCPSMQIERHQEEDGRHADVVQHGGGDRSRKNAVPKQRKIEHRMHVCISTIMNDARSTTLAASSELTCHDAQPHWCPWFSASSNAARPAVNSPPPR